MTARSRRLAARASWALLPYIGFHCDKENGLWRWWMRPARWLWLLLDRFPSAALYEPMEPIECRCDYCLGLTDEWTP